MSEHARTDEQVQSQLSIQRGIERIREALEDLFESEVREAVVSGADHPQARLHDYLTRVGEGHEPRIRLLFDLFEQGALDLSGELADAPATCFFLGDSARYQRSLDDWLAILGEPRTLEQAVDPGTLCVLVGEVQAANQSDVGAPGWDDVVLWSAGDLVWSRSRTRAQDAQAFLTLVLDEPVGLWRARTRVADLQVCAVDQWSGCDETRVVVPPGLLPVEQVSAGIAVPTDRPFLPR